MVMIVHPYSLAIYLSKLLLDASRLYGFQIVDLFKRVKILLVFLTKLYNWLVYIR